MGRTVAEIEALFSSLQTYKTNIRNAIIAQGVNVPSDATVSDYATYILQIVHVIPDDVTITSSTSLTPTYSSTTYTITFTTAGTSNWSIASNQSWCTFNTSSGSTTGSHSVTLTVAKNGSGGSASRSATITITCGTATGTISVSQAQNTEDITVNYLQNGSFSSTARGTQYIELPLTCATIINNTYKVVVKVGYANTTYNSSYAVKPFFGVARNDSKYGYNVGMRQASSENNIISFYSTALYEDTTNNPWGSSYKTTEFSIQKNKCTFIRPGTSTTVNLGTSSAYGTVTGSLKLRLFFGRNKYAMQGVRIYYCKIYNSSGTLLYNYTPVRHYNNGSYVPCYKDTVNNTYLYNAGTGTFNYG